MVIEIKNPNHTPLKMKPLFEYLQSISDKSLWRYMGMRVALDPTLDFKGDDALIRWTDVEEGYNDKLIVSSLPDFQRFFSLAND